MCAWHRYMMMFRRALLCILALAPFAVSISCSEADADTADPPVRLAADLSDRTLSVVEQGEVTRTYRIAVGLPRYPTPTGSFQTGRIEWNPKWTPPPSEWARNAKPQPPGSPNNPMQGVKIYFKAPYYFIHGTNDPESIGYAASHGCIRMTADDAMSLAQLIESTGGSVPLIIRK
jgi:lipoprotein-anchoring transpeptidase ErfK/SrfK